MFSILRHTKNSRISLEHEEKDGEQLPYPNQTCEITGEGESTGVNNNAGERRHMVQSSENRGRTEGRKK